jgi:hypothetical protein
MENNLTESQASRIGIWTLLFVMASLINVVMYYNIMLNFNVIETVFLYVVITIQFISLIEIYSIVSEKSPKRSGRRLQC